MTTELAQHPCLTTIDGATQYRIVAYLSTNSPELVPSGVSAVQIPLEILLPRISRSMLTEVAIRHHVTTSRRHVKVDTLLTLFDNHDCDVCGCGTFYTLFEPVNQSQKGAERTAKWWSIISEDEERLETHRVLAQQRMSTYRADNAFPPAPPTRTVQERVIRGFCDDIQFENLHERGCAVCGTLQPVRLLTALEDVPYSLDCLLNPSVTRKERLKESDPIDNIDGPVLDLACKEVCADCMEELADGVTPKKALANGNWIGPVPSELKGLYWTEQLLVARVMRNYCIIRVRSSGMHKMRSNAICHALPMPRVYNVLPPPRRDMDSVLAIMFIGPNQPTVEDYKRTPFLVRKNKVMSALNWLKLNHADYRDIEISDENMNEYPEDRPPVIVDFKLKDATKDPEATAVNDSEDADETTEGMCSFVVHTLTPEESETLMETDDRRTLRARALEHFHKGGHALAIGHSQDPESIYKNPQLYPQMFPWLFPYGLGGLGNALVFDKTRKIGELSRKRQLLMYHDKRFQLDPAFPLVALNHEQIKASTLGGHIFAKKLNFDETADRLSRLKQSVLTELIQQFEDHTFRADPNNQDQVDCMKLISDIDYVAQRVDGSVTSRKRMRNQIWSVTSCVGAPSWFITFAPADVNHPIALYYAGTDTTYYIDVLSRSERERLIANNPVAGARFFKVIVDTFLKHVLGMDTDHPGLYGPVKGYYGTVEQQGRLTLHLHMLVWMANSMTPQEIRDRITANDSEFQRKLVEYLEALHVGEFVDASMEEMKEAVATFDAENPESARATLKLPEAPPHPGTCTNECRNCSACLEATTWWHKFRATVNELLYRSNTHDCRHGCKDNKYGVCKARFPRETPNVTKVDMESGAIIQKKGEAWMNWFTPVVTYLLRCNTDVTNLLSGTAIKAVVAYVTDYITKSPLKTHIMFDAVRSVFQRDADLGIEYESGRQRAQKVVTKAVNALTAKSEIGGPMACMYLLGHPDHYTNFKFKCFFWRSYVKEVSIAWGEISSTFAIDPLAKTRQDQVMVQKKNGHVVPFHQVMDYELRPYELQDMCLHDWIRKTEKIKSRKTNTDKELREGEYTVQDIVAHRWSANKGILHFKVLWRLGDTTWEPWTKCKHLHCLDDYFNRLHVTCKQDLPMQEAELDDYVLEADDVVDTSIRRAQLTEKPENEKYYEFLSEHPQSDCFHIRILPETQAYVPEIIGGALPRADSGSREEYCKGMLTLFKPWRKPVDLKTDVETWSQAFETYTFTDRHEELMKFFNIRYECSDARDDFSKTRKQQMYEKGLFSREDQIEIYSREGYYDESNDVELPDAAGELEDKYRVITDTHLRRLDIMMEAENLFSSSGALDKLDGDATILVEDALVTGGNLTPFQWEQAMKGKKDEVIAARRDTAAKLTKATKLFKASTRHTNVVAVVDQTYLEETWTAPDPVIPQTIEECISQFKLNEEQRRAFRIVAQHASKPSGEQLRMYLGGMAGTGKSQVIKALIQYFESRNEGYRFMCVAPTGAAAALINGSTYHSALGFSGLANPSAQSTKKAVKTAEETLRNVDYLFVDEISMIDSRSMYDICARMAEAREKDDEPFGGVNVIIAGDFAQLPPVGGGTLYASHEKSRLHHTSSINTQKALIGKAIWHQITTVVILRQNMRQSSQSPQDAKLRTALENMRYKGCTTEDVKTLQSRIVGRSPGCPSLSDPKFRNVSIITSLNASRDRINALASKQFAQDTGQRLHTFYSFDRLKVKDDEKQGRKDKATRDKLLKEPKTQMTATDVPNPHLQNLLWNASHGLSDSHAGKLMLCLGMPVMLKRNVATECGVTNGAEGVVVGWQDRLLGGDRRMLDTVFVRLTANPQTIQLDGLPENVVPVVRHAITVEVNLPNGQAPTVLREQVPLVPNFAMTDYASQGRTRKYNVVDIQNSKSHLSIYMCLSRGTSYDGTLLLQSFSPSKIQGGISGWLRQEFRELELLDEITRLRYLGKLPTRVGGATRAQIINSFRCFKGEAFVPETVPAPLRWSSKDRYPIQDVPEKETDWRVLTTEELKEVVVTPIDDACVPAVGSVPLKHVSSIKPQKGRVRTKTLDGPPTKKLAGERKPKSSKNIQSKSTFCSTLDIPLAKGPAQGHKLTTEDAVALPQILSVVNTDSGKNDTGQSQISDSNQKTMFATRPSSPKAITNAKKRQRTTPESSVPIVLDSPVSTSKRPRLYHSLIHRQKRPLGLIWDSVNYSCAYDSLFTLLFAAYNANMSWWSTVVSNQNRYVRLLTRHFESINLNRITFEFARDELRAELYHTDPIQFPWSGRVGTDIYELCRYMLGTDKRLSWYMWRCGNCGLTYPDEVFTTSVILECSKSVWSRRPRQMEGRPNNRRVSEWLSVHSSMKTDVNCGVCNSHIYRDLYTPRTPSFLIFMTQDRLMVDWEPTIDHAQSSYRLIGLIYHGGNHFTSRIIEPDGKIWYHDGITTGRNCEEKGVLHNASTKQLFFAEERRICSVGIYLREN